MSNAQSGSLNLIAVRAPAEGAVPSGFQSCVPARRIDNSASAAPVPLTSAKLDAPAAKAGEADAASKARLMSRFMRASINPRARSENGKNAFGYAAWSSA
jgi:hypothetical protein